MLKIEPNIIYKINQTVHFTDFPTFPKIPKNPHIPEKGQKFQSRDKIPKSESTMLKPEIRL